MELEAFLKSGLGLSVLALVLASCSSGTSVSSSSSNKEGSSSEGLSSSSSLFSSSSSTEPRVCPFIANDVIPSEMPLTKTSSYTPTTFSAASYTKEEEEKLGEGCTMYKSSFSLNNGNKVEAHIVEADLSKCSISSSTSSGKAEISDYGSTYSQLLSYEKKTSKKVYAISNADFFGGGSMVNAFIKDDIIVKDSENDNGYYDYTIFDADLPASMPMLFGVGAGKARIAPIIEKGTVEETVKSKFTYEVICYDSKGEKSVYSGSDVNVYTPLSATAPDFIYGSARNVNVEKGDTVYGLSLHDESHIRHGEIVSKEIAPSNTSYTPSSTLRYVVFPHEMGEIKYDVGDYLGYTIVSPDQSWMGYDTILGARHEIIRDAKIVDTVKLETSNGTSVQGIPRTSIGLKDDHVVCLFSIEGLRYGGKSTSDSDTYGLSLTELADFMEYYGISAGANFDGGGSTELIVNDGYNGTGDNRIVTRSSDYGTYNLEDGRAVANTIVFTSL